MTSFLPIFIVAIHTFEAGQQLVVSRVDAAVRQQADEVQRVLFERLHPSLPRTLLAEHAAHRQHRISHQSSAGYPRDTPIARAMLA